MSDAADKNNPAFPVQAVRGFKDMLPEESAAWQHLEATCREVFRRYGFAEMRLPALEVTALFARTIGEATDIVEKEMYSFADRNGQSLSLRPEGTAGAIRAYIQHGMQREALTRIYYMGAMFRHERPQAGRLRQFHQVGVEALGSDGPGIDVEVIALMADLFAGVGVSGLTLELNSIGCPDCRPAYTETLRAALAPLDDVLCDNCQRRRQTNPLRVLDCKVEGCGEATANAPLITDHLCGGCAGHFAAVKGGLDVLEVNYVVNPRMVRGLDYYTRTAFEWTTDKLGAQGTVAAGGRYDGLVAQLGGKPQPGIGFALGVERLLMLMEPVPPHRPDVYLVLVGEAAEGQGARLSRDLRRQGLAVDRAFSGGSMKSQMKRANKCGAKVCVIIGDDEVARGEVTVKDMEAGEQTALAADGELARKVAAQARG